jgi:hypothetical protein
MRPVDEALPDRMLAELHAAGLVRVKLLIPVGTLPPGSLWWVRDETANQLINEGSAEPRSSLLIAQCSIGSVDSLCPSRPQ